MPCERRFIDGPLLYAQKGRLRLRWVALEAVAGCHRNALHMYATGQWRATLEMIRKLEQVLRLQPGELIAADQQEAHRQAIAIRLQKLEQERRALSEKSNVNAQG